MSRIRATARTEREAGKQDQRAQEWSSIAGAHADHVRPEPEKRPHTVTAEAYARAEAAAAIVKAARAWRRGGKHPWDEDAVARAVNTYEILLLPEV